jgi:hypothetical protein
MVLDQPIVEPHNACARVFAAGARRGASAYGDGGELGLRRLRPGARREPSVHVEVAGAEHLQRFGAEHERHEHLRVEGPEFARQHADDRDRTLCQRQRPANRAGIAAETLHPVVVREHRLARHRAAERRRRQEPADHGFHAVEVEIRARDLGAIDHAVATSGLHRQRARLNRGEVGDLTGLLSPFEQHPRRHGGPRSVALGFPDEDDLVRVRIGERPQEHGADHAEDRGRRAERDGENGDGGDRERRSAAHHAPGEDDVLAQDREVLARRDEDQPAKRLGPHSQARGEPLVDGFALLRAEHAFQLTSEPIAELERQQPQQRTIDAHQALRGLTVSCFARASAIARSMRSVSAIAT